MERRSLWTILANCRQKSLETIFDAQNFGIYDAKVLNKFLQMSALPLVSDKICPRPFRLHLAEAVEKLFVVSGLVA